MSAMFRTNSSPRVQRTRSGLTVLEFVGCVTAVLGGAWLGALCLGVNLEHAAHSALHQTQLLEKVPPQWRPQGPAENDITREQLATTVRKELSTLRDEIQDLRSNGESNAATAVENNSASTALETTRTYWLRLNEIALSEHNLQNDAETALDDTNAAKVFAIKARVSRFAAKSVEALPSNGVDEGVVKFGRELALWYGNADELYERAAQIWAMSASHQARANLTDEWKRDEVQHRQEARLLRERAGALKAAISRQFGEEFPEFAKPTAVAQPAPAPETSAKSG